MTGFIIIAVAIVLAVAYAASRDSAVVFRAKQGKWTKLSRQERRTDRPMLRDVWEIHEWLREQSPDDTDALHGIVCQARERFEKNQLDQLEWTDKENVSLLADKATGSVRRYVYLDPVPHAWAGDGTQKLSSAYFVSRERAKELVEIEESGRGWSYNSAFKNILILGVIPEWATDEERAAVARLRELLKDA